MDAEDYSKQAGKFFNNGLPPRDVLINASMGCAGEAGEFVDHVKKYVFHGHDLDIPKVIKELGDQLWYINYAVHALQLMGRDITLSSVMQENIDKLEARYPTGFSHEASKNRPDEPTVSTFDPRKIQDTRHTTATQGVTLWPLTR